MVSKYKPSGRDGHLLHLIDTCSNMQKASTQVLKLGASTQATLEFIKVVQELGTVLEDTVKELPKPSINAMVKEVKIWFASSTWREREEFLTTEFDRLVVFHSSLGNTIRNHFCLWAFPWKKEIVGGIDVSKEHPDSISQRVIEQVWRELKNESTEH